MRPQRRGWKVSNLLARVQALDGLSLLRPAGQQHDLARIENRSDAHGDRMRRHGLIDKERRVGSASGLAQRHDMRSRLEWRTGLVEGNVSIRSQAEKRQGQSTGVLDRALVSSAFDFEVR